MSDMKWINVKDKLPEYEETVLLYYEIKGKKQLGRHYHSSEENIKCFEIGRLTSITSAKLYSTLNWEDRSYNPITPTHWMPLPEPPQKKT